MPFRKCKSFCPGPLWCLHRSPSLCGVRAEEMVALVYFERPQTPQVPGIVYFLAAVKDWETGNYCKHELLEPVLIKYVFTQMSLQNQDQLDSLVDEPRQAAYEEEESIVCLSIISLNEMLPSEPDLAYLHLQSLEDRYYPTAFLHDQFCDGNEDSDYHSRDLDTDVVVSPALCPWPRWSSLPALRPGMVCLLGNFLPSEGLAIPLSSVKVAGEQISKMDSDNSFKVPPTLYSDGN